jgi:recombination DNA repair RAD52 pathway protein
MTETAEIIKSLSKPLDMSRVKRRQAPGEGTIPYLEGFDVIQTANDIFGYRWSFDLLSEPRVMIWEQAVTIWDRQKRERVPVLVQETGQPRSHRVGMVYLTGKVTVELDGKAYTHADVGRLAFTGDTPEALDTALSGAATDCLKRCFRQLGDQFGLSLYDKEIAKIAGTEASQGSDAGQNGNGRDRERPSTHGRKDGPNEMTVEQAQAVLCPVGSNQNPQWAGMPLGQVMSQPSGERMLVYLSGEQFKANGDPVRQKAKEAARVLLGSNGNGA